MRKRFIDTDRFKAVTWNPYFGTAPRVIRPILQAQRALGVTIFLFQEVSDESVREMIAAEGLESFFHPRQYMCAWDPDAWVGVLGEGVRLSEQKYASKGGDGEQYSEAARAIVCDGVGRTLELVSYHTPAHIQRPDPAPRRFTAAMESFATLGAMGQDSQCRGFLSGGDDNVDEFVGFGSETDRWAPMLAPETGLRQIQAPDGTLHRRRIDDFRIKLNGGIYPIRDSGWVAPGGGDHKLHGQEFAWR